MSDRCKRLLRLEIQLLIIGSIIAVFAEIVWRMGYRESTGPAVFYLTSVCLVWVLSFLFVSAATVAAFVIDVKWNN